MMSQTNRITSQNTSIQKSQDIKNHLKIFKATLQEIGIEISLDDEPHVLTQEQALVVRDLEKHLERSNTALESFLTGLRIICKKDKYLKKCLAYTNLKKNNGDDNTPGPRQIIEQESLFRIFLKVVSLQTEVADILLDEITSVSSDSSEDTSWLHTLLNPFRYLPYMKESEKIATRLTDVLEVATYPAQLEILDTIPEIIPDSQFSDTIKQLCKLLDEKDELTGAIIDCLNALDLDVKTRVEVQDTILDKMTSGTSLKDFPILLSFLMLDWKSQNCVHVLLKIRNALDSIMLTPTKNKEKESSKILIFNKLQTFTNSPKAAEAWLNMISSIKTVSDHKPIDYLIMFMLYNTVPSKKRIIETIFKKRVHCGLFKINTLEKMFEKYLPQQLLKDYFTSIVEIGSSLLRSASDQIVKDFCSTIFQLLFNHEYTESIFRREILNSLIVLTGASNKTTVSIVLNIILSFMDSKENLQQHIIILMRLLEKIDTFEPSDVKVVFEILCDLTCGPNAQDSMSGIKNEIHIIIRKQLCSTKKSIKFRGIIAAVVMAKSIAHIDNQDSSELPRTQVKNLSSLPMGPAREAGTLLELANTCTIGYPDLMGLYYDQLASILIANYHLDKLFLAWLYETNTADFRKIYVSDELPQGIDDLEMDFLYTLNSSSEIDEQVGINITELTFKKNSAILVLAAHFRLLRLLHYRQQDGDLSTIDALLGCAVILPKFEDVDDLTLDQVKLVIDCLFHCINWFRELISGFVTQTSRKLRQRVVKRLENLLEIENKFRKCLGQCPEHKLPTSYFDLHLDGTKCPTSTKTETKVKNPRKKVRTCTTAEADDTVNATVATNNKRRTNAVKVVPEHKVHFRDLDTDTVLLLKYPLADSAVEPTQLSPQTVTLSIEIFNFLLKDLISKLVITTQNKSTGLSHLNEVIPLHIITDTGYILPNLDLHLKAIVTTLDRLLVESDGKLDAPEMFSPTALKYKTCFGLILESLLLIFSWTGFQHSSNLEILKNMLKSIRSTEQSQSVHSSHRLITEFITRLSGYHEQCLELSHAVYLVKTMQALYSLTTPSTDVQKKISAVAEKLLSKRWYNSKGLLENGKSSYLNVDVLVKTYLSSANVETITGLVGTVQNQADTLNTKEDYLLMLGGINKQNFHVLYNGLCSALLNRIKTEIEALSNNQHIILWTNTTLTMQGLMTIAKMQESKTNLVCFLKKSCGILKIFLSHGIPMMEIMLRSKPDEVVAIFKTMQSSTRFLHHLCCYSKFTKDTSVTAYVPQFRLLLESLVYRVKATLIANNCSTAFWMGHLKNKDLHGEDILSQSTVMSDTNKGSDEELLPSDDSDTSDILGRDDNDGSSSSVY